MNISGRIENSQKLNACCDDMHSTQARFTQRWLDCMSACVPMIPTRYRKDAQPSRLAYMWS